ncbi:MAG: selenide, water dikinase SelD [Bacteroidota bacterium]
MESTNTILLTKYSHGAGCGCKISPSILDKILSGSTSGTFPGLLVGNQQKDDAAVFDLGDGTATISTTDFFMPIVDDPFDFGRIAAVNAISDVYAMGGTPMMAIAILGWPIDKLPPEVAGEVLAGGRAACIDAGIPLAGGHSIDCPEPIFGLAVTGRVDISNLKKNSGGQAGDKLFLTKPLGVGLLATAQKKGILREEDATTARDSMVRLNRLGAVMGAFSYVHAMTDVTGFGLLGHLVEMCEGSNLSAHIDLKAVPSFDAAGYYISKKSIPGGTHRNWASYGEKVSPISDEVKFLLADPQTSGGLLIAVAPAYEADFLQNCNMAGHDLRSIGTLVAPDDHVVTVK